MNNSTSLPPQLEEKLPRLRAVIQPLESAVIAFSGGVDSTLVLACARDVLNGRVLAVTARDPTYPSGELENAQRLARELHVEHVVIDDDVLESDAFCANPPERCYHCKRSSFGKIVDLARARGFRAVLDGANADDPGDHRPGLRASRELGVRSPLMEAGLTKADIRAISRALGLPTWKKPSGACLASRIPYGERITKEKLASVDRAEELLISLGFEECRVRHHGPIARIEIPPALFNKLLEGDLRERVIKFVKDLGFTYVTLDIQGFRSGSLNELL